MNKNSFYNQQRIKHPDQFKHSTEIDENGKRVKAYSGMVVPKKKKAIQNSNFTR